MEKMLKERPARTLRFANTLGRFDAHKLVGGAPARRLEHEGFPQCLSSPGLTRSNVLGHPKRQIICRSGFVHSLLRRFRQVSASVGIVNRFKNFLRLDERLKFLKEHFPWRFAALSFALGLIAAVVLMLILWLLRRIL